MTDAPKQYRYKLKHKVKAIKYQDNTPEHIDEICELFDLINFNPDKYYFGRHLVQPNEYIVQVVNGNEDSPLFLLEDGEFNRDYEPVPAEREENVRIIKGSEPINIENVTCNALNVEANITVNNLFIRVCYKNKQEVYEAIESIEGLSKSGLKISLIVEKEPVGDGWRPIAEAPEGIIKANLWCRIRMIQRPGTSFDGQELWSEWSSYKCLHYPHKGHPKNPQTWDLAYPALDFYVGAMEITHFQYLPKPPAREV